VITVLGTLTYAIIEAPRSGWLSAETVALFGCSVVCAVALIFYERRRVEALLELRFFLSAPFSGANGIAALTFAALGGFLFLNTLYFQEVRGLSPLQAGLYMLPMTGMLLIFSPLSGRLVAGHGRRPSMVAASVAITLAALMLTRLAPGTATPYLLATYFLFGIGMGLINPQIFNTAVSGMPGEQAGVAAAIASTSRQVGMTLGVAVIGAISGGTLAGDIGRSFASATHAGWRIIAGLGALIFVSALLSTGDWAKETARRTAEGFRPQPRPERRAGRRPAAVSELS
jgi:MFS family permease